MDLLRPVGEFAQPVTAIQPEDSLRRAARIMRGGGLPLAPVATGTRLVGVVTASALVRALGEGADEASAVDEFVDTAPFVRRTATTAEALRLFEEFDSPALVVVDAEDQVVGLLTPADLYARRSLPRPHMIGGMATPFGVYLTTGGVSGGAPKWALMTTGATMFVLLVLGQWAGLALSGWLGPGVPTFWADVLASAVALGVFLGSLRLLPLSGTHGAEHQVVHAIERGEELRPEVVRRMPRVHPRCGTNLAAGAMLFLGVFGAEWAPDPELRLLVAALVTVAFWRPLGSLLQRLVTTRTPSDRQLQAGIQSGCELLANYAQAERVTPSVPTRIWNSGILHVMMGSLLAYGAIAGLAALFRWPIPL